MTSTETPGGPSPVRLLGVTVAVVLGVVLLTGLGAFLAPAHRSPVVAGTELILPRPERPAVRLQAPVGWTESEVPLGVDRARVYSRGPDTLGVYVSPEVDDVAVYAQRLQRMSAATAGVTAVPAGTTGAADGFVGPRFLLTDPAGRTGEMVVLGRGATAVAVLTLADPTRPVDLRPLLDSIRVAS